MRLGIIKHNTRTQPTPNHQPDHHHQPDNRAHSTNNTHHTPIADHPPRLPFVASHSETGPGELESTELGVTDALRSVLRDELRAIVRAEVAAALESSATDSASSAETTGRQTVGTARPLASAAHNQSAEEPEAHASALADPSPSADGRSWAAAAHILGASALADPSPSADASANPPPSTGYARALFRYLDEEAQEAYESLSPAALAVWNDWTARDLDAPSRLDRLEPLDREQTMTALGMQRTPPPTRRAQQLFVQPRRSGGVMMSGGEMAVANMQVALNKASQSAAPTSSGTYRAGDRPAASNADAAIRGVGIFSGWLLLIAGVIAVLVAQTKGRTQALGGLIEEPWAQPVTWAAIAVAVLGLGLLISSTRARPR